MSEIDDPRFIPGIDLVRRCGAKTVQIRYQDEEQPVVWMVVAGFSVRNGRPVSTGKVNGYRVGAGFEPVAALFSLLDDLIDGAECTHCHRPGGFEPSIASMPLAEHICWYQWDPELRTFRRGCEGD